MDQQLIAANSQPNAKRKKVSSKHSSTTTHVMLHTTKNYNEMLQIANIDENILVEAATKYNTLRNQMTATVLKQEHLKWENATSNDAKTLWEKIDWKGTLNTNPVLNQPAISEIAAHFEEVYRTDDQDELSKIYRLQSDVMIPVLDDPISESEIKDAVDKMKKGGYDYPLNIVHILQALFTPILLILMNLMFYVQYPTKCLLSLLFAITKKGGVAKAFNYRGIQMMTAIACLFDRILAARLESI